MFDPVTVPIYLLVAPYFGIASLASLIFTGFFRGTLMSRRNHDEQMSQLAESRDEWKSTAQHQAQVVSELRSRAVIFPTEVDVQQALEKPRPGGSG